MRIALLTETYPPDVGGLATSAARLARLLIGVGHTVHVFAPSSALAPGQMNQHNADGAIVYRLGAYKRTDDTLADWFRLLIARHTAAPFDLLHAYFLPQAGFVAAYAGQYSGLPSVVSARGNDLDRAIFDGSKATHVLFALQRASAITANSADLVRKARALSGRDATLLPNGVDTELFTPKDAHNAKELKEAIFAPFAVNNLAVLGFVGEARAKKGLAPLLVAYRTVARERPCALLLVGGVRPGTDTDLLNVFKKQNPALPLVVVPYAPQHMLPSYYNLLDLLLLPSLADGLPNALLEGMACARPIIATSVGGIPDALRDNENGVLVAPGDPDALAAAIIALLDDPERCKRLAAAAHATVLHGYTPERELEANLAVYRTVFGSK